MILADILPHVTSKQLPFLLKEAVGQRKFNSSNRRLFRELAFTAVRFWCGAAQHPEPIVCAVWLCRGVPPELRV